MKINKIEINQVLGLSEIRLETLAPVQLIAGSNGQGKSSIQNAVRMAMTGSPSRVFLKKHFKKLVHEGRKKGRATVSFDHDVASVELPKGTGSHIDDDNLPYVLDPALFATLKPDERRKFMYALADVKIKTDVVRQKLIDRNVNEKLIEPVLPMLRSGFPAACDSAKDNARDAKAVWKEITGQQWGAEKAEDWEPDIVDIDLDEAQDRINSWADVIDKLDVQITGANQKIGEIKAIKDQQDKADKRVTFLTEKASKVARFTSAVGSAKKQILEQEKVAEKIRKMAGAVSEDDLLSCPCCSVALLIVNGGLLQFDGEVSDGDSAWDLEKHENGLAGLKTGLKNYKVYLNEANAAISELDAMEDLEEISEGEEGLLKDRIKGLNGIKAETQAEINAEKENINLATKSEEKKNNAEKKHQEVLDYLLLAQALAPDGIPGEFLLQAVKPFNKRLKDSSDSTEWMLAKITPEFEIEADGRPYCLLSESEQWRCDAMLAEAISHISGLKLIMLDRMDVLDIPSRSVFLNWILDLAEAKEIDTALIFATLKSVGDGDELIQNHWLDNGSIKH